MTIIIRFPQMKLKLKHGHLKNNSKRKKITVSYLRQQLQ